MSDAKYYDIRFTNKQMMNYNRAVHHLLELSENPSFYEGIRDSNSGYKGTDESIRKEVLDPIIKSLGQLRLSKRSTKSPTKKITNFNKHVTITPLLQHMITTLEKKNYDTMPYYVDKSTNTTDSSKVRKIIRNYLEVNQCHKDSKWTLTKNIKDAIPDLMKDMKQKVPTTQSIWNKIPSPYHRYIFREEELKYCPLNHERVPRHRLATQEEIDNLPRGELPVICTHDIICRWLGFQVGDIIAIERKSTYYRRVV
ncbi:hypothetical protein G6F27_012847 [Rhizopus arrhizus]|nr:hypothetical protein G6F27_012847 [Rhizopus arrhizus]